MKEYLTGIQLYSIREALKQDFKGVCRELVKLGCDGVEPAFYFGDMEPEELAAFFKEIGMKVCGISCITNMAAGISPEPLSHQEVFDTANRVAPVFRRLVKESIIAIGATL